MRPAIRDLLAPLWPRLAPTLGAAGALPPVAIDFETFYRTPRLAKKLRLPVCSVEEQGNWAYCRQPEWSAYLVAIYAPDIEYVGPVATAPWPRLAGRVWLSHNRNFDRHVYERLVETGALRIQNHDTHETPAEIAAPAPPPPAPPPLAPPYSAWHDTADLAVYAHYPRALAQVAALHFRLTLDKSARADMDGVAYADLAPAARDRLHRYALEDAALCWALWADLSPQWPEWERQLSLHTGNIEFRGIPVDRARLDHHIATLETALWHTRARIPWIDELDATGQPCALRSKKALDRECLKCGVPPPTTTAQKSADFLAWLDAYGERVPAIYELSRYRRIDRALSIYRALRARLRPDGRAALALKYMGAEKTGRWSGAHKFNLQNLAKTPLLFARADYAWLTPVYDAQQRLLGGAPDPAPAETPNAKPQTPNSAPPTLHSAPAHICHCQSRAAGRGNPSDHHSAPDSPAPPPPPLPPDSDLRSSISERAPSAILSEPQSPNPELRLSPTPITHNPSPITHNPSPITPLSACHVVDARACLTASPGRQLIIPDLSQIEPRVLNWLVGNHDFLRHCRAGRSPYEAHAIASMGYVPKPAPAAEAAETPNAKSQTPNLSAPAAAHAASPTATIPLKKENPALYALAKARLLALGYGAGWQKFIEMARGYLDTESQFLAIFGVAPGADATRRFLEYNRWLVEKMANAPARAALALWPDLDPTTRHIWVNAWLQVTDFRRSNPLIAARRPTSSLNPVIARPAPQAAPRGAGHRDDPGAPRAPAPPSASALPFDCSRTQDESRAAARVPLRVTSDHRDPPYPPAPPPNSALPSPHSARARGAPPAPRAGLWETLDAEFRAAAATGGIYEHALPSGRILKYWHVSSSGGWTCRPGHALAPPQRTYGGLLTENLCQAISRDCFGAGILNLEAAGYEVLFHVHDEAIIDAPAGADPAECIRLFTTMPAWAAGLPLASEAEVSAHYKK